MNMEYRGRVYVPENASPVVRKLFQLINLHHVGLKQLSKRSGVALSTIADWRNRRSPSLANIEATLNALGYELTVRKRER